LDWQGKRAFAAGRNYGAMEYVFIARYEERIADNAQKENVDTIIERS